MAGEVMRKVFQTTKAEDMVCLKITMPKTRSFCHIDLIHRSSDFSPWEHDKWTAFLRISNSYNRTRLLRFELGFCRWICMNGMIFGSKSIEFSYAHTRRGMNRVERFEDNIGDIRRIEATLTESLHQLKRYYVPPYEMLPIVCRAFDISATSEDLNKPRRVEALALMRDQVRGLTDSYFRALGPHGYAALNVLTMRPAPWAFLHLRRVCTVCSRRRVIEWRALCRPLRDPISLTTCIWRMFGRQPRLSNRFDPLA